MSVTPKFFLAALPSEGEVRLYESVVTAIFRCTDLGDEVPASEAGIDLLMEAAREVGVRVLGSLALHQEVIESLVDVGIGFGTESVDLPAALGVLADLEVLALGREALLRLSSLGYAETTARAAGIDVG